MAIAMDLAAIAVDLAGGGFSYSVDLAAIGWI